MSERPPRPWRRSPEAFLSDVAQVLPWAERHLADGDHDAPWSTITPGAILEALPRHAPVEPESLDAVLSDLNQHIKPGLVRWDTPGWMAWFPCNAHPDSILGDFLSSVMSQQGMLWLSSPACTELEMRMLEWLRQALGLPATFAEGGRGGGVIQDTASSAVLATLVAARERATNGQVSECGPSAAQGLVAYCSHQAHSSMAKAVGMAGIGRANLRAIDTDKNYCLDIDAFQAQVEADLQAGLTPFFCSATVGTTASGAFDPVEAMSTICKAHDIWLHVDAAWAGSAAISSTHRDAIVAGAEHADSWCFNPHKWLGAVFDCCCLWIADRHALTQALAIDPEYLRNARSDEGLVIDYRDWHVQLGRRFRALKLWLLLRRTGVAALAEMINHHIKMAITVEQAISQMPHLELAAPRSLSLVCARHHRGDQATQEAMDQINASGRFAVTHCNLGGQLVIRFAIGALLTEHEDMDALIELLSQLN